MGSYRALDSGDERPLSCCERLFGRSSDPSDDIERGGYYEEPVERKPIKARPGERKSSIFGKVERNNTQMPKKKGENEQKVDDILADKGVKKAEDKMDPDEVGTDTR